MVFGACLALGTGVNGLITIDSPLNITYSNYTVEINVSADNTTHGEWTYSLDGETNVSFLPNISVNFTEGFHNLSIFFTNSTNESLYGQKLYGQGLYGYASVNFTIQANQTAFTVRAKRFLMEIYLTFEFIAVGLMVTGLRRKYQLINTLLAMGIFFSLSVMGLRVEQIAGNIPYVSDIAVWVNFGFGMLCLMYVFIYYMYEMREGLKDPLGG